MPVKHTSYAVIDLATLKIYTNLTTFLTPCTSYRILLFSCLSVLHFIFTGHLSHWVQKALSDCDNTSFLLIDRGTCRYKVSSCLYDQNSYRITSLNPLTL